MVTDRSHLHLDSTILPPAILQMSGSTPPPLENSMPVLLPAETDPKMLTAEIRTQLEQDANQTNTENHGPPMPPPY